MVHYNTPETPCRARVPEECDYHGARIRAANAMQAGDRDGWLKAMDEMRAAIDTTPEMIDLFASEAALLKRERERREPAPKPAVPTREPVTMVDTPEIIAARTARIAELKRDRQLEAAFEWQSEREALRRHQVDMTFGSTTYEFDPQDIDSPGLHSAFLHGHCALLAHELHVRTGLPLALFSEPVPRHAGGWSGHVGLLLDEATFLDVSGKRPIKRYLDAKKDNAFEVVTKAEFLRRTFDPDYVNEPLSFLDELEALVTQQTAVNTLRDAGLLTA